MDGATVAQIKNYLAWRNEVWIKKSRRGSWVDIMVNEDNPGAVAWPDEGIQVMKEEYRDKTKLGVSAATMACRYAHRVGITDSETVWELATNIERGYLAEVTNKGTGAPDLPTVAMGVLKTNLLGRRKDLDEARVALLPWREFAQLVEAVRLRLAMGNLPEHVGQIFYDYALNRVEDLGGTPPVASRPAEVVLQDMVPQWAIDKGNKFDTEDGSMLASCLVCLFRAADMPVGDKALLVAKLWQELPKGAQNYTRSAFEQMVEASVGLNDQQQQDVLDMVQGVEVFGSGVRRNIRYGAGVVFGGAEGLVPRLAAATRIVDREVVDVGYVVKEDEHYTALLMPALVEVSGVEGGLVIARVGSLDQAVYMEVPARTNGNRDGWELVRTGTGWELVIKRW